MLFTKRYGLKGNLIKWDIRVSGPHLEGMAAKAYIDHTKLLEQKSSAVMEHLNFIGAFAEHRLVQTSGISRAVEDPCVAGSGSLLTTGLQ